MRPPTPAPPPPTPRPSTPAPRVPTAWGHPHGPPLWQEPWGGRRLPGPVQTAATGGAETSGALRPGALSPAQVSLPPGPAPRDGRAQRWQCGLSFKTQGLRTGRQHENEYRPPWARARALSASHPRGWPGPGVAATSLLSQWTATGQEAGTRGHRGARGQSWTLNPGQPCSSTHRGLQKSLVISDLSVNAQACREAWERRAQRKPGRAPSPGLPLGRASGFPGGSTGEGPLGRRRPPPCCLPPPPHGICAACVGAWPRTSATALPEASDGWGVRRGGKQI